MNRLALVSLVMLAFAGCFVPSPRGGGGTAQGGGGSSCNNSCQYAYDGECDDGRAGADTDSCGFGTDCSDCEYASACDNSCQYAYDGECDDGRAGSSTSTCSYGTDCNDCGS
jgi:protease YdgD